MTGESLSVDSVVLAVVHGRPLRWRVVTAEALNSTVRSSKTGTRRVRRFVREWQPHYKCRRVNRRIPSAPTDGRVRVSALP